MIKKKVTKKLAKKAAPKASAKKSTKIVLRQPVIKSGKKSGKTTDSGKKKKKTQKLPSLTKRGAKGTKKVLAIRHASHEHLGSLADFLKERKIAFEYLDISDKHPKFPSQPEKYSCIIHLGGPQSVLDIKEHPWMQNEVEFIKKAYDRKVAQVGLCLGAQLMATAFGGTVYQGSVKEVGWYSLRLTRDGMRDPLLIGFESEPTLFQWHEDAMILPKEAPSLAGTLIYPNQAFRMNAWTYGFQFHFEVDEKMIAAWLKKGDKELKQVKGYIDPKKIKEDTKLFTRFMRRMAMRFYESLFEYLGYIK
jgi:GMP synthase (glutamine-hydrolysing)